ncbi:hypothetical protein ACSDQ9_07335 [Aestuariimicrobium soli]|uniref:hypothetical protein n=1 Tax=Aestuariimicrobium soli TaxID=2035834 RepID=UPI003EBD7DE4
MNDTFRDRLDAVVPDPPKPTHWASRAEERGRSRRRRFAMAGSGAALVAVVVAVIAAQLTGAGGAGRAVPAAPTGTHTAPVAVACPADSEAFSEAYRGFPAPVTLPHGAVSLQWCTGGDSPYFSEYAPPEPLTTGLDAWVDTYNALKTPPRTGYACTADASIPGMAILSYADGSRRVLVGMAAGCGEFGGRLGFTTMQEATIAGLQAQRNGREPAAVSPATHGFTPCQTYRSTIPARLEWVTQVAVCTRDAQGGTHAAMVDEAAVPALVADVEQNRTKVTDGGMPDNPVLQLRQANGEFLRLEYSQSLSGYVFRDTEGVWGWVPSQASRRVIAAVGAGTSGSGTPGSPTATSTPSEGTTQACQGAAPTTSTDGTLPAESTQIWFCSTWRFGPAEPLTTGIPEFVASLGTGPGACSPNRSDEWFVALQPDGTSVRLDLPAGDCHPQQRAIETFVRLMTTQREQPGWAPATARAPGKLCLWDTWRTLMPMTPDQATEVRFCDPNGTSVSTDDDIAGRVLTASDRQTVVDDLVLRSTPQASVAPGEVVLVLLRPNGELIWVRAVAGQQHQLTWDDATGRPMVWTPGAESQAVLDRYAR